MTIEAGQTIKPYRQNQIAISLLPFLAAILLVFIYLMDSIGSTKIVLAWFYIVILSYLILLTWYARYWLKVKFPNDKLWLHPPLLIYLWIIILWGVPGLYSIVQPDILAPIYTWTQIDFSYSVSGFILIATGCFILMVAYMIGLTHFKPSMQLNRLGNIKLNPNLLFIFYVVTVFLGLLQIRVTGIAFGADISRWGILGNFQQWIGYFIDINLLILSIYAMMTMRREISPAYLGIVASIQIMFGIASGFMKPVVWLIIIILLAIITSKSNIKRIIIPIFLLVLIVIAVVPVAEYLRSQIEVGAIDTRDVGQVASTTVEAIENTWVSDSAGSLQTIINRSFYRQALVAQTPGIIMNRTPADIPYEGIEQFLAIPAYVIPRAIWTDKPVLSRGNWFGITYLNNPTFTTSSAAITVFGEGYMFAGWTGTILACIILGLLLSLLYRKTVSSNLIPIFLALTPVFIDVEGQITGMFAAIVQRLIIYLLFYWLIAKISFKPDPKFSDREKLLAKPPSKSPEPITRT